MPRHPRARSVVILQTRDHSTDRAIALREQITLQALSYNYSGFPLPVPPLTWSSSDATVASVDANGVVTGLALGHALIKAVGGGMTGYLTVQVRPATATR